MKFDGRLKYERITTGNQAKIEEGERMTAMLTGNKTASMAVRGDDFYASPYAALPPLLVAEGRRLPRQLWEPSCGNGALVLPLRNRGFKVTATDLNDWGCPGFADQVDFFSPIADRHALAGDGVQWGIVTNPPFGYVEEYIERATSLAPYVALLLRLAFLESEGRMNWFPHVGLQRVHVIGERLPMMHRHGYEGPKLSSAGMCFAWFIFEKAKPLRRTVPLRWISWKESCKRYPQTDADIPPATKEQPGLFENDRRQLDRIERGIMAILRAEHFLIHLELKMSKELDDLTAEVAADTAVEASAVILIQGLVDQIKAAGTDPVALKALTDSLTTSSTALAKAVSDNTPAAP